MDTRPDTASRLRRLLDDRGMTFRRAAELAGMPHQQVWRLCSGKIPNPGIETVRKLVEAIGGSMADLYNDDP